MITEGQIIIFRFPQTNQLSGKFRPALVIKRMPGNYNDWLTCMISSNLNLTISGFDEMLSPNDVDFQDSGLKEPSIIRIARLAVVNKDIFIGRIGQIDNRRLLRIKQTLSRWIQT